MSVVLNPGFSGYVAVEDQSGKEIFRKAITSPKEAKEFVDMHGKSVPGYSMLKASIILPRTDNIRDLSKDLFLPTFINHALKVNNFILRLFASVIAIIFDVITLIPRLIVFPFKANSDRNKTEHSLVSLVKANPDSQEAIKDGILKIKVAFQEVKMGTDPLLNMRTAKKFAVEGSLLVITKTLPESREESQFNDESIDFLEIDGEWDAQSRVEGTSKHLHVSF
jgi:hypothetical protein